MSAENPGVTSRLLIFALEDPAGRRPERAVELREEGALKVKWFWQRQPDVPNRRAHIRKLLDSLPAHRRSDKGTSEPSADGIFPATDAALEVGQSEYRSVHELLMGNPNSDLVRKFRWLDMLREAHADGAERMVVLDAAAPGGVHVDVDVKLSLCAAELDVLDALAPNLRRPELAVHLKQHLHVQALEAMAEKDMR